jgi:hypothetical protein
MANEIMRQATDGIGKAERDHGAPPPDLERSLRSLLSRPDLTAADFSPAMLAQIKGWDREVDDSLRPAAKSRIISILGQLGFMAMRRVDDEAALAQAHLELRTLQKLPEFALEEAVLAFVEGKRGDGHFRPMPGELLQEAERRCARLRLARHWLDKAIEASRRPAPQKPSTERRVELAQMLRRTVPQGIRDLQAELDASGKPPAPPPADAEARQACGENQTSLSADALRLMRRARADEAAALRASGAE